MRGFYKFFSITAWVAASFLLLSWPKILLFKGDSSNTLHIFGWADSIDERTIHSFEEKYHAKVRLHCYGSNEEMLTKMKATKGRGFDLIIPSDYAIPLLKKEGLLKEIDRSKLSFYKSLNPRLLGHAFDPENNYSIPLQWVVYGFGINKEDLPLPHLTYDQIFNSEKRIVMLNDPIEAINFAAFYLYGPVKSLTPHQIAEVKEVLLSQKEFVEAYVEVRADYLLATRNCSLALAQHYYLWRMEKDAPHVDFVLPEGPIFTSIESLALPQKSDKEELTYAFINHLYEKENLINQCNTWCNLPPTETIVEDLEFSDRYHWLMSELDKRNGKKFHFIQNLMPEEESRKLWIEVKG
ncbi:MAG: extracellular solute-binding protein [Candidatus Algichlamydia australiensis]|nr:extracellular solute-binding protein [Chlamydiales bacterium]